MIDLASFAFNIWAVSHDHAAAFYSPASRFWELMAGSFLAATRLKLPDAIKPLLSLSGFGAILIAIFLFVETKSFPGWVALIPTTGTCALIVAGPNASINRYLSWTPIVGVGLISYPLYLWHWPLLTFARIASSGDPTGTILGATLAISLVLATATYFLVERPIKRWRLSPVLLGAAIAGLAIFWRRSYSRRRDAVAHRKRLRYPFGARSPCQSRTV
jgi:peptidoglycan/LPS O-acetylase OafA/YrhL